MLAMQATQNGHGLRLLPELKPRLAVSLLSSASADLRTGEAAPLWLRNVMTDGFQQASHLVIVANATGTLADSWNEPLIDPEYVLSDLLIRNGSTVFYGDSGVGKSTTL